MNIRHGFESVSREHLDYFRGYTYEKPVVLTPATFEEMKKLGLILHTCINHMINHYREYQHLMYRNEKDLEILGICSHYPASVGTFRTDFVVNRDNAIKIIEIGARKPLDGYFLSGFFREIAMELAGNLGMQAIIDSYPGFFSYLESQTGDATRVCIILGNDKTEDFKFYLPIMKEAGMEVMIIPVDELPGKIGLLKDSWVIEELTLPEIHSFSKEVVHALCEYNVLNPIRTILTAHDKRFFYVLGQEQFTADCLTFTDQAFLLKYLVPTFIPGKDPERWLDARKNKDDYILKNRVKGRSEDLYAGTLTTETRWKELFDTGEISEMVLQPFIDQKKFTGMVGTERRKDYITGTLLYFNDEFFGPGLFRTSSEPVTNLQDFRKAAQLVADKKPVFPGVHYL